MSDDSFSEVTTQSWFSRISESLKGILFGIILIIGAIFLLFWNEGRSVTTYKTLKEGAGSVVSVKADKIDPAHESKLVHMGAKTSTEEILSDSDFSVSINAIKLRRDAKMYQWKEETKKEKKKNLGGSETTKTTYSYSKTWASGLIDSSEFKKASDHQNPHEMRYGSKTVSAKNVSLGAFRLSPGLIGKISNYESLSPSSDSFETLEQENLHKTGQGYYIGADPSTPVIGDIKVSFEIAPAAMVSIVAKQTGSTFEPHVAEAGGSIELLSIGTHSAANMFSQAQSENTMMTWGLRIFGFILVFMGFSLIFKPLSVLADVIPIFGDIVGIGTGLVAGLLALIISLITIAIAWFFYRPILSIILLTISGGAIWYFFKAKKKVKLQEKIPNGAAA